MRTVLENVTLFCFGASYAIALILEAWHTFRPRPIERYLGLSFGLAGLFAHTVYVVLHPLSLASPVGSLLFLAWILAIFYLYGSFHHGRFAWGLFVLPLVLGLVVLAWLLPENPNAPETSWLGLRGEKFWGLMHGTLVMLSAVGISVGFIASLMYLVQVRRLKAKLPPLQGVKMFSLERIEQMNRRAILWAFPFLTAGILVGVALQIQRGDFLAGWDSPKILSSLGLWVVFAILLYLRYGIHVRGRQVAVWTILAFGLLVLAFVSPVHPFLNGEGP